MICFSDKNIIFLQALLLNYEKIFIAIFNVIPCIISVFAEHFAFGL